MKIVVTGEKGFIGIHLINYFRNILKYEVIEMGRDYLCKLVTIQKFDWLVHGAFLHRSSDPNVIIEENRKLTLSTIACLKNNNVKTNIVFLSSIHEDLQCPYGIAKRESRELLERYCFEVDSKFIAYKIPNVFGRFARPNKTSFIATFCYNLHNNIEVKYNKNLVKLDYIDNVIPLICSLEEKEFSYTEISVEEVYFKLLSYKMAIDLKQFPTLHTELDFHLFQTYLDYKNYKI